MEEVPDMIKNLAVGMVLFCILCALPGRADTVTVVLQNGLNNYLGCDDAYFEENVTTAVGPHSKLAVKYG